jgi:pimeloyl-ACP methyl ester carboxylesterase/uncharacterized membrane protein YbhN (UPF0104 family)
VLGHLHWIWIPAAIVLEAASMAAFAIMLRRLLAAGGASVGVRPMLATAYAANAVSVSVSLAGPGLATAFTFRRFSGHGADAPLAGWSLLAGGVISSAAAALVGLGGGLASGNILAAAVAVPGGVLAVALLLVAAATRRPRLRGMLERPAAWTLQHGSRLLRRPAAGAAVPWHDLLLVYGSGIAAQSLNITPGGLGVTEGTLSVALVATGLHATQALAAVLLYRLASFWLVASAGWLVMLWLRRRRPARPDTGTVRTLPSPYNAARPIPAAAGIRTTADAGDNPDGHTAARTGHAMTADTASTGISRGLGAHELVLLHGQPGSAADWRQLAARLPARLHAVAPDRPGYGSSRLPPGGFAANAQAVLDDLDARGIQRALLVGHSYGGGVALSAASLAPHRVEAVVLLASVGPGCVNGWDRLLAAPGTGPLFALAAWRLTPWIARARLARIEKRRRRPPRPGEHVNWQVWAHAGREHGPLWRTFLAEQRALLRELDELQHATASVQAPVLLLADPQDTLVPVETARRLARALPDARLQFVEGAGHHLPRRAPDAVAAAIVTFLAAVEERQPGTRRAA